MSKLIRFLQWRCFCNKKWNMATDGDSEAYQIERALIAAEVTNHYAECEIFNRKAMNHAK
jgi:hypothetical protein